MGRQDGTPTDGPVSGLPVRGMPVGPKSFMPHLTVWCGPERVSDLLLKRPFRWAVRKFWLVRTSAGQRRPDYIGEWPLG